MLRLVQRGIGTHISSSTSSRPWFTCLPSSTLLRAHGGGGDVRFVGGAAAKVKAGLAKGSGPSVVEAEHTEQSSARVMAQFLKHLWPAGHAGLKLRVLAAMALLVGSKLCQVQVPFLFKEIVDSLASAGTLPAEALASPWSSIPLALLLGYGAARAGGALFQEMRNAVFANVTQAAIRDIATRTYLHLLQMDLKFHVSRETGGLSRAIDRGMRGISFVMSALLFNVVPTALEIALVCGIFTWHFGWPYAAVTASTVGIYTLFTVAVTKWRTQQRKAMNALDNQAASVSVDALLNYETVQYFNAAEREVARYDKIMAQFGDQNVRVQRSLAVLNFGQSFIFSAALTAVMVMASGGIVQGALTLGDLVMLNGLLFQLSMPLNFLGSVYREVKQALVDMDVLFALGRLSSSVSDQAHAQPLKLTRGEIDFRGVSFGYEGSKRVLQSASFTVPAGQKVAIVGTSGSGKTTLFRLIYRFYDPIEGEVHVDGQNLRDVTLSSLRSYISVVPQDLVLFNASIRHNIAYGAPDSEAVTDAEIEEAARLAHVHESIMRMPQRYETIVGERGVKLSGGERQRVCLARALLKRPRILLLDEATSGLDAESEHAIQSALDEIARGGRTVLLISHRLKTVQNADKIVVFHEGRVVEEGTHALLMAREGVYANLVRMQQLKDI